MVPLARETSGPEPTTSCIKGSCQTDSAHAGAAYNSLTGPPDCQQSRRPPSPHVGEKIGAIYSKKPANTNSPASLIVTILNSRRTNV